MQPLSNQNFPDRALYHADNLDILRGMNSESVNLIATDPPFNKGRDFHATPESLSGGASFQDRWSWKLDVHEEWIDSIKDDWPGAMTVINASRVAYGDDMGAFLCFMGVRLMEMHRILRHDGSIYLHCDDTASHYLKSLMDAVFGRTQFRNEVIWRRTAGRSDAKQYGRVHDVILFYSKSDHWKWNRPYTNNIEEYVSKHYTNEDHRGVYRVHSLMAPGVAKGDSGQEWRGINPGSRGRGRHWSTPTKGGMCDFIVRNNLVKGWPHAYKTVRERLDALDAAGLVYWPPRGKVPGLKQYLAASSGRAVDDIFTDVKRLESNDQENVDYPTQKPLDLYRRFIEASSDEGDIVLDPFVGCATTPVAAEQLGRRWVGIDIWSKAYETVLRRLRDERLKTEEFELMDEEQVMMLTRGDVHYSKRPPVRTDNTAEAAPRLRVKMQRPTESWHKLTHARMRSHLADAQAVEKLVVCAGCGRSLELDFMELDHITPKTDNGENWISNRILLCGPCNRKKSNSFTLSGLVKQNKADGWMMHPDAAEGAKIRAQTRAGDIRDGTIEI